MAALISPHCLASEQNSHEISDRSPIPSYTEHRISLDGFADHTRAVAEIASERCWDWEAAISTAADELVLPLLHDRVDSRCLPPEIEKVLRAARDLNAERNETFIEELGFFAKTANEIGIEPVVLKGCAHILTELYSKPSDRYLTDIDVLASPGDVCRLMAHASRHGYVLGIGKVGVDCHHQAPIQRPGKPIIEIHTKVGGGRVDKMLPAVELIQNSTSMGLNGTKLRVPSQAHTLIHDALHSQLMHGYQYATRPSLRSCYDFLLLSKRLGPDLQTTIEAFESHHRSRLITLHRLTVNDILTGDVLGTKPSGLNSTALRHWHRKCLRKFPNLRYFDPYYLIRAGLGTRGGRLIDLCKSKEGRRYILAAPTRISFYKNLAKDIL